MNATLAFLAITGAALAGTLLTAWFRSYALRRQLLDVPNARSSHAVPTPRGGGSAIVLVITAAMLIVGAADQNWRGIALLMAVAGSAVAIVGFVDDHRGVAPATRFLVHALGIALLLFATRGLGPLALPGLPSVPLVNWGLAMVALLWLLNLFNFMDGIDGIAAMEAAFVSLGLAGCLYVGPGASGSLLVLCLATGGASIGFLRYNWPPARIFMGDVGSGFLGFVLGALAVISHREAALSAWVPAILLGVFVTDATVTLLRRFARADRWYEAHRTHAYQQLSRRFGSHLHVTLGALTVNILWLLPLALAATCWGEQAWVFAAVAYAPLIAAAIWAGAGCPEPVGLRR